MEQLSDNEQKKRRFLLFLPLVCLPFLVLFFWLMGGGKVEQVKADKKNVLNMALPDAKLDTLTVKNKLDYYNQARQDSLKRQELMNNDPNYNGLNTSTPFSYPGDRLNTSLNTGQLNDQQEERINERLALLKEQLNKPSPSALPEYEDDLRKNNSPAVSNREIERLEQMMKTMSTPEEKDPEMEQINGLMGKILDLQHPELVQQRLKEQSAKNRGQVYSVRKDKKNIPISTLDNKSVKDYASEYNADPDQKQNGFYGLETASQTENEGSAIEAVVHQSQTIVSGANVKLRLTQDVYINGTRIPKDNFVYGTANLSGERLEINIENIRFQNTLFPVKLAIYDLDGIQGIYIPGAITRDVAKQNGDQALQSISPGTFDQSIGAQAASAGLEIGRNLMSKKIKLIKVEIKAGYKVLLKDGNQKEK